MEIRAGDVGDPAFAREACEGAAVIYECLNPGWRSWPTVFPRLQANLLEGAAAARARYVSFQNLWMYGRTHGRPLTEDLPHAPEGPNAAARARMAEELFGAHRAGRVRVTAGRASELFGPGVLGSLMGERVFPPAVAGRAATVVGDPDTPHTYTYVPDLGRFLVTLGERDEALGRAWHLPSPETVTTREFLREVYSRAGHRLRIRRLPRVAVAAVGLLNPRLRGASEIVYQYEEPFVVDHSRFRRTLGGDPTPLGAAVAATVGWFAQGGAGGR
jgi:nucleoside-diphosphate-sugar epimerase